MRCEIINLSSQSSNNSQFEISLKNSSVLPTHLQAIEAPLNANIDIRESLMVLHAVLNSLIVKNKPYVTTLSRKKVLQVWRLTSLTIVVVVAAAARLCKCLFTKKI
jgi:hypothetical protein